MESFVDFSITSCERNIKYNKKWVRYQLLWCIFIVSLLLLDFQTLYISPSAFHGCTFGAMVVTAFWAFIFFIESSRDLCEEKKKLRFLNELRDTQLASAENEHYRNAKNMYERLIQQLKEKQNDRPSEPSTPLQSE